VEGGVGGGDGRRRWEEVARGEVHVVNMGVSSRRHTIHASYIQYYAYVANEKCPVAALLMFPSRTPHMRPSQTTITCKFQHNISSFNTLFGPRFSLPTPPP
jgi:hypothetical protein